MDQALGIASLLMMAGPLLFIATISVVGLWVSVVQGRRDAKEEAQK
ncbi:MAG: hypothetical protein RRB13_11410 [bacterium]|nr:hypothetical protein [bacterium]